MFRLLLIFLPMCLVFAACQRTGQRTDAPVQSSTLAWLLADDGTRMTTEEFLQNPKVSRVHGIDPLKGLCLWDKANDVAIMDQDLIPSGLDTLVPIQLLSHEAVDRWLRKYTAKETPWCLRRIVGVTPQELQLEVHGSEQEKSFILSWTTPVRLPRSGQRDDPKIERVFESAVDVWFNPAPLTCCFHLMSVHTIPIVWDPIDELPPLFLELVGTNAKQVLNHLLRITRWHIGFRDGQAFVGTAEHLLQAGFVPPPKDPRTNPWTLGLATNLERMAQRSATFSCIYEYGEYLRVNENIPFALLSDSPDRNRSFPMEMGDSFGKTLTKNSRADLDWMTRSGQLFIGSQVDLAAVSAPRRMVHQTESLSMVGKNAVSRLKMERLLQTPVEGCCPPSTFFECLIKGFEIHTGIFVRLDASVSATITVGFFWGISGTAEQYLSHILSQCKLRYALEGNGIVIGTEKALRNQGYDDPPDLWDPESVDLPWMARLRERLCNTVSLHCNRQHDIEDVWFSATKIPLVLERNTPGPDKIYDFENLPARDILHQIAVLTHTAPILRDGAILLAAPERIEIERRPRVWKAVASTPSQVWAQDIVKVLEKPLPKDLWPDTGIAARVKSLEQSTGIRWHIDPDIHVSFQFGFFAPCCNPQNLDELVESTCFAAGLDYCIQPGQIRIGSRDTIAATGLRLQQ